MSNNKMTVIKTVVPAVVSKAYREVDGVLEKSPMADVVEGIAKTFAVGTADEMVDLLKKVTSRTDMCLCAGSWHNTPEDGKFYVTSESKLAELAGSKPGVVAGGVHVIEGKPIAARLKRGIDGSHWLLLDADNPPGIPAEWAAKSIAERLEMWEPMLPGITKCERIELRSSSSRVLSIFGSEQPKSHAWIRVSDAAKIPTLKAYLSVNMVLKDVSFTFEKKSKLVDDKVVGIESRSVFDLAVMDTGRLVFCSEPIFEEGMDAYVVDDPGIEIINPGAGALDIDSITLPSLEDIRVYRRMTNVALKISEANGNLSVESVGQLAWDTEIERRGTVKTLKEWFEGMKEGDKLRCESPFRESRSEAAFVGVTKNNEPFVYDVGNGTRYYLSEGGVMSLFDALTDEVVTEDGEIITLFDSLSRDAAAIDSHDAYRSFCDRIRSIAPTVLQDDLREMIASKAHTAFAKPNGVALGTVKKAMRYEPAARVALATGRPRYDLEEDGKIRPNAKNHALFCASVTECGMELRYDEFIDAIMLNRTIGSNEWEAFLDEHYNELMIRSENCGFTFSSKERMRDAVYAIAKANSFDSAQLWLSGLEWDGVKRIGTFFSTYFGVEDSPYSRAVSEYAWTALAGRVISPGCQADMTPVLVGSQGLRKTSGIKAMSPDIKYFVELSFGEKEDDLARKMRGKLIGEIAELRGLRSREKEHIKAWMTRTHENWTPKFKEFSSTFARRLLFIGSTNDQRFLDEDSSGQRRWLPMDVTSIDTVKIKRDCLQLWAEAREVFLKEGVSFSQAERLARGVHADFVEQDSFEQPLMDWMDERQPFGEDLNSEREFLRMNDLLKDVFNIDNARAKPNDCKRIANILRKLGWHEKNGYVSGKRTRIWIKDGTQ